jgi:valyl-tRNA synthetase
MKMEKKYKPEIVERKWLESWNDSLYYFDESSDKPSYIIDTPPPYPTGDFHVGNALNWCYIDFIARYKRMRGYNVMFPQGWDCHGLPTEVKVEERQGISKSQIDKQEFRDLCKHLMRENIAQMKEMMQKLGMSIDWSKEFVTMDDRYKRYTQLSFVKMYREGLIYQEEHPVNWCPRCETAIAFAEVEYEDRAASLNYILFKKVDVGTEQEAEYVEIATTRPELLASCVAVAVHPDDERYKDIAGKELVVPIFGHTVKVYEDESVDPEFGTGVVMICTFGDRQDVRWWKLHNLPLIESIDERGKMTEAARGYEGLSVKECKTRIIEDLNAQGLLRKREPLQQNVGVCWRCKTPIEIISTRQWFVRVMHDEIIKASEEINWYPEHFAIRLKNWVDSMEWDWCISRQRIFSVPIPVWYCLKCGTVKVASEDDLPVDPSATSPEEPCANCGGREFKGEDDVLDTWMDSSLSALWVAGWDLNAGTSSGISFPTALRPQGHDIIRTWAFYTILRSLALTNAIPWHTILINGMVLGEDGYKMSKSRNNFISPDAVIQEHGVDVFRQWAAIGGAVGSDVQFRWKDIVAASKFMQKLWSILRFSMLHLSDYEYEEGAVNLRVVDKWLLSKLNKLVLSVTDAMETYKFDEAMKDIRAFAWNVLADDYIELAKSRLYGRGGDEEGKESARYALYVTLETLAKLLAPFAPFFAEEMYSYIEPGKSIHKEHWPEVKQDMIDVEAEMKGDVIADIVRAVRRYKSEHGIPLNAPLGKLEIYVEDLDTGDVENATATKVEFCKDMSGIKPDESILDVNGTKVRIIR